MRFDLGDESCVPVTGRFRAASDGDRGTPGGGGYRPQDLTSYPLKQFGLSSGLYQGQRPGQPDRLFSVTGLESHPELLPPFTPAIRVFAKKENLFSVLSKLDVLLMPVQSFTP